ncbi:hypothetical protein APA_3779 [Pseudanabaena sp. lw0831]|uniref:nSTAND1 domain-containing NTPase n=1 Tax=Pseudanabaena sp. lw0831 TaxID=1357935 RepID=UPI0019166BA7|nr:pentapeptide repeat-containing protein [Pseudanabaena sp. lw0831]GBO55628.1 hypothetical protein APA_3779 [Pseudanabaena sp. lw0831]
MASLNPDNLKTCTVKLSIDNTHGTGFFVAAGLILTCHHVVKNAGDRPIKVRWQNQEDFAVAKVLQSFPDPVDLALLQFETVEALACVELDGAIAAFDDLFAYGYPDVDPNGAGVVLRCDGLNGDQPPKIKFSDGRVRSGLSGAPLLNPATGMVCGVVKYTEDRSLPLGGGGIPIATVFEYFPYLANLNRQFHQPQWGDVNPYKGLAYFEDDDARFFFGRTALTDSLLDHLEQNNFLALLGASGSGKSSVLRAGLLNQLRQGQISGSDRWELQVMLPTERPLNSLANTFVSPELEREDRAISLNKIEELIAKQGDKKDGLRQLVQTSAAPRVILVIDQFEECFTLCQDLQEREHFFGLLWKALELPKDKFCLAIAMRADFFGKCVEREYGGLSKRIAEHLVPVTPMNDDELREAIDEPAKTVGCEVEPILREEIVRDVAGAPANLPLMQFALSELWQSRDVNRLTLQAYKQKLGGIAGALEKRANAVYAQFTDELDQRAVKHIFLSLTQLGEGTEDTRRRAVLRNLPTEMLPLEVIEKAVKKLADEKLVVTTTLTEKDGKPQKDAIVDVAHETLIRRWTQLRMWLDENRQSLRQQRKLEERAEEWQQLGKPKDYLIQGLPLRNAIQFSRETTLSSLLQEFINQGQRKQIISRILTIGLLGVPSIMLFILLPFWVVIQSSSFITSKSCISNPNARIYLQILMLTGFKKQLKGANICNQTLFGINLSGARLEGANLDESNFSGANFRGVSLEDARLRRAYITKANLEGSFLVRVNFEGTDLEGSSLAGSHLGKSSFKNTNLNNVNLKGAILMQTDLKNALNLTTEQVNQAVLCQTQIPSYIKITDTDRDCNTKDFKNFRLLE